MPRSSIIVFASAVQQYGQSDCALSECNSDEANHLSALYSDRNVVSELEAKCSPAPTTHTVRASYSARLPIFHVAASSLVTTRSLEHLDTTPKQTVCDFFTHPDINTHSCPFQRYPPQKALH